MLRWSSHRSFHQARDANDDASLLGRASSSFRLNSIANIQKRVPPGDTVNSDGSSTDSSSNSSSGSTSDTSTNASGGSGSSSSSSSPADSSSCTPGYNCPKQKSGPSTQTLAIVLGVILPVVAALAVFYYLHRKHVKKTRREDATDKHGSLDFGLGPSRRQKEPNKFGKRGKPEMTMNSTMATEKMIRGRGMSMDMGSPYVMPQNEMSKSRPSMHSNRDGEDPYGPVKMIRDRSRSPNPPTRSTTDSSDKNPLLANVQTPSRSGPLYASTVNTRSSSPVSSPTLEVPRSAATVTRKPLGSGKPITPQGPLPPPPPLPTKIDIPISSTSNFSLPKNVDRSYLSAKSTDGAAVTQQVPAPPMPTRGTSKAPRLASIDTKVNSESPLDGFQSYAAYAGGLGISQNHGPSPGISREQTPVPDAANDGQSNGLTVPSFNDPRRLSASMRPLPPDVPEDNPEQRANRIRSFYREYFDDSAKPDYGYGGQNEYHEDYGQEYLNDATVWDPDSGQSVLAGAAPYGEPIDRNAMTPPPRGPPRFTPAQNGPGGHRYTSSSGHSNNGGRQRAFSTASGRPQAGARGRPVKRLPPPVALSNLPTPHLLKDDASAFSSIDFAPPTSLRDRAAGRSQSPRLESRPYSPSVRAHTPLVSAFNEMAAMPSPHALQKSATFTGLDFAPPPRFRNQDGGSDAGSIRSGRSGMSGISASHAHNVRHGAYDISRLPKNTVGTKDDLAGALKPSWDMNR